MVHLKEMYPDEHYVLCEHGHDLDLWAHSAGWENGAHFAKDVGLDKKELIGNWFFTWGSAPDGQRIDVVPYEEAQRISSRPSFGIDVRIEGDVKDFPPFTFAGVSRGNWKQISADNEMPVRLEGFDKENLVVVDIVVMQDGTVSIIVYETMVDNPIFIHLRLHQENIDDAEAQLLSALFEALYY